jgi:hypothetical protein
MHTIAIRMAYPSVFGSVLFGQFTPHCCLISAILVVVLAACHAPLRALRALDQPATKLTGTTIDTPAPICCARLIFSFKGILRVSLFEGVGGQRSALPIRRPAPFLQLPSLLSQAILLAFKWARAPSSRVRDASFGITEETGFISMCRRLQPFN